MDLLMQEGKVHFMSHEHYSEGNKYWVASFESEKEEGGLKVEKQVKVSGDTYQEVMVNLLNSCSNIL